MKNNVLKRLWNTALLLTAVVTLGSCNPIYEDLPGCDIYVDFRYDYNMSGKDNFAAQCDKVELFVFDSQGILRYRSAESGEALSKTGYRMRIPVEYGEYTIIAWAGHKESYELANMHIGTSTKEELMLRMWRNDDGTHDRELESLWHGTTTFTYAGDAERTQTVSLVKNTNTLNLTLRDTSGIAMSENLLIKVTAKNGSYNFDNSLCQDEQVTFLPYFAEAAEASLSMLRLIKEEDVRLSITDKKLGTSLLPAADMDLIDYLLMTKPDNMSDQEYLDRQDVWDIGITYSSDGFIALSIIVNGWVVWIQDTDL